MSKNVNELRKKVVRAEKLQKREDHQFSEFNRFPDSYYFMLRSDQYGWTGPHEVRAKEEAEKEKPTEQQNVVQKTPYLDALKKKKEGM